MLQQFLHDNRHELVDRCRERAALRSAPGAGMVPVEHGIPVFLDQLIASLRSAENLAHSEMGESAARHGAELLQGHFPIDQVVHNYGDLCQAIMELAIERGAAIEVGEFRSLNQALDNAIADAVSEYCGGSSALVAERGIRDENERLGHLAHELRNQLHTATLALSAIKAGNVGLFGATGALLDRTMISLRRLVDHSLMAVRIKSPLNARVEELPLDDFIRKAAIAAALDARATGCTFEVANVDPGLALRGDSDVLASALGNLLQNAFKFSHQHGEVSLNAYARGDRIVIEVCDSCGGLPPGMADEIFVPFVQAGSDRTGLGLGLAIVKRCVEANEGILSVRDAPPVGCVFTIELPRYERQRTEPAPQSA